jgi:hypothetical protein
MAQSLNEPRLETANRLFALVGRCKALLARAIGDARARAALRAELAHLKTTGELDRVLNDLGIGQSQISTLIENHPGSPRRLAAMLHRLSIEVAPVTCNSADMRAIQRTCLLCAASGHCERWLGSDGSEDPRHFCPNAAAFADLVSAREATYQRDV